MDYDDNGLTAMPKLVGGPRYSRPPVRVTPIERPPNPDDLPLVAARSPEDEALAAELGVDAQAAAVLAVPTYATTPTLNAASVTASGTKTAHPHGTRSASSGASSAGSPSKARGLGGILRGRNGRSGPG